MERECHVVCAADAKIKIIYIQIVGMGTINFCPVSTPDIFKTVLLLNSIRYIVSPRSLE